jgi:hypothetical protein
MFGVYRQSTNWWMGDQMPEWPVHNDLSLSIEKTLLPKRKALFVDVSLLIDEQGEATACAARDAKREALGQIACNAAIEHVRLTPVRQAGTPIPSVQNAKVLLTPR